MEAAMIEVVTVLWCSTSQLRCFTTSARCTSRVRSSAQLCQARESVC